jgi:hypothetical protein
VSGSRRIATTGMVGPAGHYCGNPDCGNGRRAGDLLCRACWHRVPRPLRLHIWHLGDRAPGSPAHQRACAAAIRAARRVSA